MGPKYHNRNYTVNEILVYLSDSKTQWAIPRLQRPFVWKSNKVCSLISSMFMGYPIGTIMTWKAQGGVRSKSISSSAEVSKNDLTDLILDGQQRLTSLKILFEGMEIPTPTGKKPIKIQFNPLSLNGPSFDGAFREYKNKPQKKCIDVSSVLKSKDPIGSYAAYLDANPGLTDAEKESAKNSINELLRLREYQIACVEVSEDVDVENAAEIFYRINSLGTELKSADFILTLLEVGDSDLRDKITKFARDAAGLEHLKNIYIPESGDALAALVGYSFRQSAGKKVYDLLRGREGKKFVPGLKEKNFDILKSNVDIVCDIRGWKEFLSALMGAGICHRNLVTSDAALITSYVIYLMMIHKDVAITKEQRQRAIQRWMLFCTLTSRYTSHTDSQTAKDSALFDECPTGAAVAAKINEIIDSKLNEAYWSNPFNESQETIATICLIQQNAKTLFSKVHNIKDQYLQSGSGMEVQIHHIFPQAYLANHPDESERRDYDKSDVSPNKASIDAKTNGFISDKSPKEYAPEIKKMNGFNDAEWDDMCATNALPPNWHLMDFDEFVAERARLMPGVIKKTFDSLR